MHGGFKSTKQVVKAKVFFSAIEQQSRYMYNDFAFTSYFV